MKSANAYGIIEQLSKYHHFEECIIEEISWLNFGIAIEVRLNYIWQANGTLRQNLDEPEIVILRFNLVQEFHMINALNAAKCESPELINWGVNEIASVKYIENSEYIKKYKNLPVSFHHISFLWERGSNQKLDVVFSELEIETLK